MGLSWSVSIIVSQRLVKSWSEKKMSIYDNQLLFKVKKYTLAFPLRNKLSAEDRSLEMNLFFFLLVDLPCKRSMD